MLKLLLSQFIKSNGRKPNNLEMILLRQKASKEAVNERKIVNMFDRQPVDANKPILGGKNIIETDEQMIQRFKNQNKEAVERLKIKKDPPEELAGGGVAGLLGERTGYNEGLTAKQLKRQDTENLASKIKKLVDIQGSGTMSGKQQIQGAPKGITSNKSFINLIANLDIPISEFVSLLGDVQYNKFRDKIQKGNDELFLEDPASSINKRLGIGFDSGAGTTASAIKNLETGDNEFRFDIKKPIDFNKLLLRRAEGGPARQNFAMGKRAFLKAMGAGAAGIAGLKTGLFGLGKKAAVKTAAPIVAEAAVVPPHFLKLVAKIKALGDDAPRLAVKDKEIVTTYSSGKPGYSKDYTLTEDITTGEMTIQRTQMDDALKYDGSEYYGRPLQEEVYMSYKPGKGQIDETTKGKTPLDEYTEDTALIRNDKPARGEVAEEISGVPDDIFEEVGEAVPEAIRKDKADGGRIGFAKGKGVMTLLDLVKNKFGKKSITTADKIKRPKKTLDREMFKKADDRLNDKRQMTADELEDFEMEIGGDNLEAYYFDGTVGDAKRILKEEADYKAEMFAQYKMGKLDPVAGDKSPARKRFLQNKLDEAEGSGDSRLITRDEMDELESFDLSIDDIKMSPEDQLKNEFPGIEDRLIKNILTDDNPQRIAEVKQTMREALEMQNKGMGSDDIITTFKGTTRRKQATGGLAAMLGE